MPRVADRLSVCLSSNAVWGALESLDKGTRVTLCSQVLLGFCKMRLVVKKTIAVTPNATGVSGEARHTMEPSVFCQK